MGIDKSIKASTIINMETKLYHKDLGIPESILSRCPGRLTITPIYSEHAHKAAGVDRYGKINLPAKLEIANARIIEIETCNDEIVKIVYRLTYTNTHELCVAIIPGSWLVKTLWLNCKTDKHFTLDKAKYTW